MANLQVISLHVFDSLQNLNVAFLTTDEPPTCPLCHRVLSSPASVAHHQEHYCRYRQGKKAKPSTVARQDRNAVAHVEDQYEFYGEECCAVRTQVSANGRARDFEMEPTDVVRDVERWLLAEEGAVRGVYDRMDEF